MQLKFRRFSMKRMLLLLGGLAVIVAIVTALALQSPDRPGNGISGSDAVQRAWEHSDPGAVTVRSAEIKRDFVTGFDLPTHHWVWVVTFNGQWHLLCSGHVTDGSGDHTSEWLPIDSHTSPWIT